MLLMMNEYIFHKFNQKITNCHLKYASLARFSLRFIFFRFDAFSIVVAVHFTSLASLEIRNF